MKRIFIIAFAILAVSSHLFAESSLVGTTFNTGNGEDEGINHVLNLVVDIMTIGIGVLGVLGITIVGIQYLTAGGNEEQTRKAKRRMYEIVIGLVAYVLVYALLNWLIPNFQPLIGG